MDEKIKSLIIQRIVDRVGRRRVDRLLLLLVGLLITEQVVPYLQLLLNFLR